MKKQNKLNIISQEANPQLRLALLIQNGYIQEASDLIWRQIHTNTPMFYFNWHGHDICQPPLRVTGKKTVTYVIISPSSKLDLPNKKDSEMNPIVFELGWERKVLGWSQDDSQKLVQTIAAHALVRPLNQWSFRQAEGTGRAVRQVLSMTDPTRKEISALHLVYQLRQADFGHICDYLNDIHKFPFGHGGTMHKPLDTKGLVDWIVDQLLKFGWTQDRVVKELLEWIYLKNDTWPQWLIAVATADVFDTNSIALRIAVRHWTKNKIDYAINTVPNRTHDRDEMSKCFSQIFLISKFGPDDKDWVSGKLVEKLLSGKISEVEFFLHEFGHYFGIKNLNEVFATAMEVAACNRKYTTAIELAEHIGTPPNQEWLDVVKVYELPTK